MGMATTEQVVVTDDNVVAATTSWEAGRLYVSVRVPSPAGALSPGWERAAWTAEFRSDAPPNNIAVTAHSPWLAGLVNQMAGYDKTVSGMTAQTGRVLKDHCETIDWRQQLHETHQLVGLAGFAAVLELFPETIDW